MATAIDEPDAIAGADKGRNLIAPVAAVAEAAMQQDDGRAGSLYCVPDPGPLVLYVAFLRRDW